MFVSVDLIEDVHYSAKDWRCTAYTKDPGYENYGYGAKFIDGIEYKVIGCGGNYSWGFFDDIENDESLLPEVKYDESLLPKPKNPSVRGLKTQKAGKQYNCYHCKEVIPKGVMYERYAMRHAGKVGVINEVFCIGHRDKLREVYFGKSTDEIKRNDLVSAWDKGVLV